jgi:hypothetical protein
MKRVLIISPYFPPSNAADMQRVRMSLPYFKEFGWEAEIVGVDEKYSEMVADDLLFRSVPKNTIVHKVKAFSKNWTSKLGLGSIALRSLWFYRRQVNRLLTNKKFDLIYFSTTQFPVCILGAYWKRKFKIPYVIDMQDPWHSDYYQNKPKAQRPKKYWFSYRLNKYLEPIAMKSIDGLIAVSESYIQTLTTRYPSLKNIPSATITFGASELDMKIAAGSAAATTAIHFRPGDLNMVYLGRGGTDMHLALSLLFRAVKMGLDRNPGSFKKLKLYFIGTSYAPTGKGICSILPLAEKFHIGENVIEQTDRVPFYQGLRLLQSAGLLLVPGSDDARYTASKLYPYIQSGKPIVGILHENSNAVSVLRTCLPDEPVFTFPGDGGQTAENIFDYLDFLMKNPGYLPRLDATTFERFSAKEMTRKQTDLFKIVINEESRTRPD